MSPSLILKIVALILWLLVALLPPPAVEPYRLRLTALGLFLFFVMDVLH